MIRIDGSTGEGGGQILRTALTLSIMTSKDFIIENIRSGRVKAGLRHQHLQAVEASRKISNGQARGVDIGSGTLAFSPGKVRSGNYEFDIGTAGSTTLVFQTIFLPLSVVDGISKVSITGGTHVPWSPSFHYLSKHWLTFLNKIGLMVDMKLDKAGYYPRGGGKIIGIINPTENINGIELLERGKLIHIRGISAVSNLPRKIAERQRNRVVRRLGSRYPLNDIRIAKVPSSNKGTFLMLIAEFENSQACFVGLGAPGKPSESVADEAIDPLVDFILSGGVVDPFMGDQLLLPLVFAKSHSSFRTSAITQHLLTNSAIVRKFLSIDIVVDGDIGKPGNVTIMR